MFKTVSISHTKIQNVNCSNTLQMIKYYILDTIHSDSDTLFTCTIICIMFNLK